MLKSIVMACSEYKENKKTRQVTTQTTLFLIWLTSLSMIEKRSKRRLKKEIFIIVKNIALTKNWFFVSNFWEFTECLRQVNQAHFLCRNCFCTFVLRCYILKLIKNPFMQIKKKQLIITNFTLVMRKIAEKGRIMSGAILILTYL